MLHQRTPLSSAAAITGVLATPDHTRLPFLFLLYPPTHILTVWLTDKAFFFFFAETSGLPPRDRFFVAGAADGPAAPRSGGFLGRGI